MPKTDMKQTEDEVIRKVFWTHICELGIIEVLTSNWSESTFIVDLLSL